MEKWHRVIRSALLLALTALGLLVCGRAPAPATATLKKTSFVIANLSFYAVPVVLAKEKGYFTDEGIDLEITTTGSGTKATAAIVGGSADFGSMEFSDMLAAVDKRQPIQAFAAFFTEPPVSIVMKKSIAQQKGVTDQSALADKLTALKGLKIAITSPGSGTDTALRWSLINVGLDPERDVEIVPSRSGAERAGRLRAGAGRRVLADLALGRDGHRQVRRLHGGELPARRRARAAGSSGLRPRRHQGRHGQEPRVHDLGDAGRLAGVEVHPGAAGGSKEPRKADDVPEGRAGPYDLAWKVNALGYPKDPRISERHVQLNVDFKNTVTGKKSTITFEQVATNKFVDAAARRMR